mmetsp:Transcript_55594/g.121780  ORF Transcript_55594/g.121780 Transcript_55594/m.121780 type:complete len:283 (+) Transcript_55594:68-916(+)
MVQFTLLFLVAAATAADKMYELPEMPYRRPSRLAAQALVDLDAQAEVSIRSHARRGGLAQDPPQGDADKAEAPKQDDAAAEENKEKPDKKAKKDASGGDKGDAEGSRKAKAAEDAYKCPITTCPKKCALKKLPRSCSCVCGEQPPASTGMGSAATAPQDPKACSGPILCWWKRTPVPLKMMYTLVAAILVFGAVRLVTTLVLHLMTPVFENGDRVVCRPRFHAQYAGKMGSVEHRLANGLYNVVLDEGQEQIAIAGYNLDRYRPARDVLSCANLANAMSSSG